MINRINALRFPLIISVVLIHTWIPPFRDIWIINIIRQGVTLSAVPTFFLISGYLYFRSTKNYWRKLGSRIRTLLVPYIAWNLIALVYMAVFFGTLGANTSQFWFLQELMLLVVVAPLLYFLHQRAVLSLVVLVVVWLVFDWGTTFPVFSSMMPLVFFYAGSVIAVKGKSVFMTDRYGLMAVIISAIITPLVALENMDSGPRKIAVIAGVMGALYLSKYINNRFFLWLGGSSFFVYCFHQPILGKMIWRLYLWTKPATEGQLVAFYFGTAIVTCAVGVGLFEGLKRVTPGVVNVLAGGRE